MNIDSFFQESSSVGQVHYRRMVSIEESLCQTQANVSALMEVDQSKELLDFAERRRLPKNCEISTREYLRKTYRELQEFYES